jgi:hypothetical protein
MRNILVNAAATFGIVAVTMVVPAAAQRARHRWSDREKAPAPYLSVVFSN